MVDLPTATILLTAAPGADSIVTIERESGRGLVLVGLEGLLGGLKGLEGGII